MKISAEHASLAKLHCLFRMIDDVLQGEEHIKGLSTRYLPLTAGMKTLLSQVKKDEVDASSEDVAQLYADLKFRAQFNSWSEDALLVMVGLIAQVIPTIDLPASMKYMEENATNDGFSITELFQRVCYHLVRYGKVTLVGDVDEDGKGFIALYDAYSEYNWASSNQRGRTDLSMVAFKERVRADPSDYFNDHTILQRRAYMIDPDTGYAYTAVSKESEDAVISSASIGMPSRPLTYLPVVRLSAINNIAEVSNPPLLPLVRCTLKAYLLSADLYSALHRSAHPQLWVTGVANTPLNSHNNSHGGSPKRGSLNYTGAGTVWTLPANSTVGYAEPQGTLISKISEEISKQKASALEAGAKVMDIGVESGDAREARQNDQYATLYSIIKNAAKAIEQVLRYIFDMTSAVEDKVMETSIRFEVPSDFGRHTVDGTLAAHLLTAAERGAISFATYWQYLTTGKMPERTILEELEKMGSENIKLKPITGMVETAKKGDAS